MARGFAYYLILQYSIVCLWMFWVEFVLTAANKPYNSARLLSLREIKRFSTFMTTRSFLSKRLNFGRADGSGSEEGERNVRGYYYYVGYVGHGCSSSARSTALG